VCVCGICLLQLEKAISLCWFRASEGLYISRCRSQR
jgi:hypothetical protein